MAGQVVDNETSGHRGPTKLIVFLHGAVPQVATPKTPLHPQSATPMPQGASRVPTQGLPHPSLVLSGLLSGGMGNNVLLTLMDYTKPTPGPPEAKALMPLLLVPRHAALLFLQGHPLSGGHLASPRTSKESWGEQDSKGGPGSPAGASTASQCGEAPVRWGCSPCKAGLGRALGFGSP